MSLRVSFGLPEIMGSFGCFGLIQANYVMGSILLFLGIFGIFCRYALELQAKKESNEKIESVANTIKDALLTPQTWGNFSNKNMH